MEGNTYPITMLGAEILGQRLQPEREYKVKLYDFKRPDKFSLEQIHTVRAIHETFGRLCAPVLSGIIGRPIRISCHVVDQLAYYEFFESIPQISAFVPVSMAPLKTPMLMRIDGTLAQLLVRSACGSAGAGELEEPTRGLTEIECVVLRDVVEKMTPVIDESWRNVIELTSSVIDIQTDPQNVRIVPPTEMIVLGSMQVVVDNSTAFINFAIPYLTIEPIIGKLSAQWWYSQVRSPSTITGSTRAAGVPVDTQLFAEAEPVRLADLSAVVAGELLELPTLSAGLARIAAGSVSVAEVAVKPMELSAAGSLALTVASYRPDPGAAAVTGVAGDGSPFPALLSTAVDSLTQHIREVRRAVEEIRDDRETLLADLADRQDSGIAQSRESELDRRHHHDIAVALAGEDPTTIGFVLAGLAPETAAAVLTDLDPATQPDVIRSIVVLSDGDRSLHRKLLSFLGRRITRSLETTTNGGPDVVAEILNHTPRSVEKHVMETFLREDKAFFEEIAKRMFVFEDFVLVDPVAIKKLMGRVSADEMALAMKGMPGEVVEHIENAVDPPTLDILRHVRETLGRVRRRDVESAQRDMIEELRQLEQAGEVVVARPDEVIE